MSQVTKRALEASLKNLLLQKPLSKITISDITEDCGINRMTFYYHFKDIYDLVEWSCQEDASKALAGNKTYETWQQGFLQLFKAVQDNKPFIMNVYHSVSREQVENYLYKVTYDLLEGVVEEQARGMSVREEDKAFIATVYKYAFVGLMLDWIKGDMKGDPAVVRTMVENALPAAEWCRDVIGVEFQEDNLFFFGGHSKKRSLIPKGATGLDFITKFSAAAEKRGIPIITNMKAEELVRDASGRVTGVKATMDGKSYTFSARKGVVIATGGFAANVAMRTEANPFYGDGFKTTNMPGAMGEGITMAKNIGAQVVNMGLIQTYPMCDPNSGAIELIDDARFEGAILVNQEGKRFVEELQRRDVMSKAILEQTGKYCYAIFNGEIEKRSHAITHHQDEVEVFTKTGILHKADTIEGIADFFKIPVDNLKATIARVNEFARTGKDLDFNYRSRFVDLSTGPYWIYRGVPSVHHTMGGLKINPKAEVLDANDKPIPGLWAAGEVTGCTHGTNRLGSNAYTDIIVFGRIAGAEVAK